MDKACAENSEMFCASAVFKDSFLKTPLTLLNFEKALVFYFCNHLTQSLREISQ